MNIHKPGTVIRCECCDTAVLIPGYIKYVGGEEDVEFHNGLMVACKGHDDLPYCSVVVFMSDGGIQLVCEEHGHVATLRWTTTAEYHHSTELLVRAFNLLSIMGDTANTAEAALDPGLMDELHKEIVRTTTLCESS
jgi:hypothetical protein